MIITDHKRSMVQNEDQSQQNQLRKSSRLSIGLDIYLDKLSGDKGTNPDDDRDKL